MQMNQVTPYIAVVVADGDGDGDNVYIGNRDHVHVKLQMWNILKCEKFLSAAATGDEWKHVDNKLQPAGIGRTRDDDASQEHRSKGDDSNIGP